MALKDMVDYIHEEVHKEVEDQINSVKIQLTQSLISLGGELERQQEEKLYHITTQLAKREEMLKAEQDFLFATKYLKSENEFAEQLLQDLKSSLLSYTKQNHLLYHQTQYSWLKKTLNILKTKNLQITICENDQEIFHTILSSFSIQCEMNLSTKINAGFIAQSEEGVVVDLSFDTLFSERKQQLLNIVMQILKESL
ncbi:MAG: hypothetical protein ACRCWI_02440 [Brevinema sp.]